MSEVIKKDQHSELMKNISLQFIQQKFNLSEEDELFLNQKIDNAAYQQAVYETSTKKFSDDGFTATTTNFDGTTHQNYTTEMTEMTEADSYYEYETYDDNSTTTPTTVVIDDVNLPTQSTTKPSMSVTADPPNKIKKKQDGVAEAHRTETLLVEGFIFEINLTYSVRPYNEVNT